MNTYENEKLSDHGYSSLPKRYQKSAFLCCTNSDQLTLGGSQTHIFEGIANFRMCFENSGT